MSTTLKERIHLLHQTPLTPLFLLKTKHGEAFDVREGSIFLAPHLKETFEHFRSIIDTLKLKKIQLKEVILPDIKFALEIARDGDFSTFSRRHQMISSKLTKIFLDVVDLVDLPSVIAYVRDRINPRLYFYSLAVALAHRADTKTLTGDILKAFPSNFITTPVLEQAKRKIESGTEITLKDAITPPATGTYIDEEYRVAFFREDLAVNSHHWHWHIVYPHGPDLNMVNKDRRGELFFYMHQQMMGRYNNERLCALLPRVQAFSDFRERIPQGHYPKLTMINASRDWSGRPSNLSWRNLNRPSEGLVISVEEMISWRMRIEQAIDTGSIIINQSGVSAEKDGSRILRSKDLDIDMLGNIVEASILSPNMDMYGDLHNNGHMFAAFMHDPDLKYLEPMGVMGDTSTAIRDPYFFRWHALIDNIFQRFKSSRMVKPYQIKDLFYEDIIIQDVELIEDPTFYKNVLTSAQKQQINSAYKEGVSQMEFHTYWMMSMVKVYGLDLKKDTPMYVNYTHLDHVPFTYRIVVNNRKTPRRGTVRIFMAPTLNENGTIMMLKEQRRLFVEMDRFVVNITSGTNTFIRKSIESSVTIPLEQSFPETLVTKSEPTMSEMYCRCGWPQHMLLPKGVSHGAQFQLFIMVSDYEMDKVVVNDSSACKESSSFCGLQDNKYPDARSMGYPFDRAISEDEYPYISDYVGRNTNMVVKDVLVKFSDVTVPDPRSKSN